VLDTLNLFIGYDPREAVAYHVFSNSAIRHSSRPLAIHPLAQKNMEGYQDPKQVLEGYPQSNQFIFSRFLVPYLMDFKGVAAFFDGDMLLRDDVAKLFDQADLLARKAVWIVKHNYKTKSETKYLNQVNKDYPRKNWSSVILWNCAHYKNRVLTPDYIANATGQHLHRFEWLDDDDIGTLQAEWNWLPDEYGPNKWAKLIHFTLGTPCFLDEQYSLAPMAEEWHRERMLTNYSTQSFIP
jgi:hypothetical protein